MSNTDKFLIAGLFISALLTLSTLFYDCRSLRVFFLIVLLVFQMLCYYRAKKNWGKNEKGYYRISNMHNSVFIMADSSIDFILVAESWKAWRGFWSIFCNRWNWCFRWFITCKEKFWIKNIKMITAPKIWGVVIFLSKLVIAIT